MGRTTLLLGPPHSIFTIICKSQGERRYIYFSIVLRGILHRSLSYFEEVSLVLFMERIRDRTS